MTFLSLYIITLFSPLKYPLTNSLRDRGMMFTWEVRINKKNDFCLFLKILLNKCPILGGPGSAAPANRVPSSPSKK